MAPPLMLLRSLRERRAFSEPSLLVSSSEVGAAKGLLACIRLLFEQLARKRYALLGRTNRHAQNTPYRMRVSRKRRILLPQVTIRDSGLAENICSWLWFLP